MPKRDRRLDFEAARSLAKALPGVEEGTSYGTPAFRVGKKLFARLHQDGDALVVWIDEQAREAWLARDPETFFITDHYVGHPWILVCLENVDRNDLRDLLERAWQARAPARLRAARERT